MDKRIYPTTVFLASFVFFLMFQTRQFKRIYERIRNDKYLVGQRLINFERNLATKTTTTSAQDQE